MKENIMAQIAGNDKAYMCDFCFVSKKVACSVDDAWAKFICNKLKEANAIAKAAERRRRKLS